MLILLRHAKTVYQTEVRMAGHQDAKLAPEAAQQIYDVGKTLSGYQFDAVFSSDLSRATDTMWGVLKLNQFSTDCPIVLTPELRERSGGVIEGMKYSEIRKMLPPKKYKLWQRDYFEAPPQGESLKDLEERVIPFMKSSVFPLVNQNQNVLVVAHAHVLRVAIGFIKQCEEHETLKWNIENAIPYFHYGKVEV